MSAVVLSQAEHDEAARVSREIGRAFANARTAAGVSQSHAARAFGIRRDNIGRFELGYQPNVKLGTVVRFLGAYGLTLRVVPKDAPAGDVTVPTRAIERERDAARWRWIRQFLTPLSYGRGSHLRAEIDLEMPPVSGIPEHPTVEQIADAARGRLTRIAARGAA